MKFKLWKGSKYKRRFGLLILSESAYCWETGCPKPNHPTENTVKCWSLDEKKWNQPGRHKGVYARAITRTLCADANPSYRERVAAWSSLAYSIYVQRAMQNSKDRPSKLDFERAEAPFLELLNVLRPARVFVTGHQTWDSMPYLDVVTEDRYRGAYRLKSGQLAWCLAVPHPQSRQKRFQWRDMAGVLADFRKEHLPTH